MDPMRQKNVMSAKFPLRFCSVSGLIKIGASA